MTSLRPEPNRPPRPLLHALTTAALLVAIALLGSAAAQRLVPVADGFAQPLGGDPLNAGQDLATPLGALLRFDVDAGGRGTARAPTDNPFVATPSARPEIWAYGLRNPWRFSFDPRTGDLWIADVGQNPVEEVNLLRAGAPAGANFGWRVVEGDRCFAPARCCDPSPFEALVATYTHDSGWGRSVTGGVVPYGPAAPSLAGHYVFGDFVSGRLFVLDAAGDGFTASPLLTAGFPV
ncbi:MAG: PQQ-dependent sugar dehydrogenase, partial [Trueperaceae bacterium]|nr:PQQ-dependent sugar dehydrogenase [Trueperaceae bacterium]